MIAASYGFPILLNLTNLNFRKNMVFLLYVISIGFYVFIQNEDGDPQATLNSTYNLEESNPKEAVPKNPLKDLLSFNEGHRSSDEFVIPSATKSKRTESEGSAALLEGGVKKRRKLFSTSARNNSTSFFGPLE